MTLSLTCLLFAGGCAKEKIVAAKKDTGLAQVRVSDVRTRVIQRTVESVGTMFPFEEALISAEVDGLVDKVNADLGDQVTQGQVLVQISDEEQRYLVAQQEAQLRQSLERLGLREEKERVKDVRDTPDVRRARADLFEAEQRFKRTRELVDQGIAPKTDMDQSQARFQAAQAAYDQTLNQTRNLIQEIERFKATLDLQRKKLRDTNVRAPFTAYVKERQVNPGQFARANTPLFVLVKIDPIRLRIEVPERMAPWVKVGQKADVVVEAFGNRNFEGKVWRIAPSVDPSKRTFVVEALIQNPRNELKPGSYATARILTDKTESIKTVPVRAVNYVLGTNKAYVVKPDQTVEVRDVRLGERFPQEVEVVEGIADGERVATSNLGRLDTGAKVRIAPTEPAGSATKED